MPNMKLYPHQERAVRETPDKFGLWFKMRTGKSCTSIRLACDRTLKTLIISPKSVVNHWHNEIETWKKGKCELSVIGRERFAIDWEKLPPIEGIIVDEAHAHFSNYKNKSYKALDAYIKRWNVKCLWLLTGTPVPASCWSVYSYGKLLGRDWRWYDWDRKFFYRVKMGSRRIPMQKEGIDGEIQEILKKIGTVVDIKDVMEVVDDEYIIENFTLNKKQKELIDDSFDPTPIVRYTSQHQLEQGVLKSDGYRNDIIIDVEKDKRLVEIVKDTEKVVIVCRYHNQINKYVDKLKDLGRNIYLISGKETRTASEIAPEAENDPSAIVIAQADTCVGYSLKSFPVMIFASMSYSFVNYEQMKYRIKAMDKKEPCTYIHLITEGSSIDKAVYDCVMKKKDFDCNLYNNK